MKILLAAGSNNRVITSSLTTSGYFESIESLLSVEQAASFLKKTTAAYDLLLLTDHGINEEPERFEISLNELLQLSLHAHQTLQVRFITRNSQYYEIFSTTCKRNPLFNAFLAERAKISITQLLEICLGEAGNAEKIPWVQKTETIKRPIQNSSHVPLRKPTSIFFAKEEAPAIKISAALHKVVIITGDRCSGVTSTAANLAVTAASLGLSTVLVDFDLERKGSNLYFSKFGEESELRPELGHSLIKCLAKPESVDLNSCRINDKLNLIALSYGVDARDKHPELISEKKIHTLLSSLSNRFNLTLLDVPMTFLRSFPSIIINANAIGLCFSNSIYGLINTVTAATNALEHEDLTLFKLKCKAILTKFYNDARHQGQVLDPDVSISILNSLSNEFEISEKHAGVLPFSNSFNQQIDTGRKICTTDKNFRQYFSDLLNQLL